MTERPCTGPNCQGHPHSPECRDEYARSLQSTRSEEMESKWIPVSERKPKCNMTPNSLGVPVLIWPPHSDDGYSETPFAYYGCRQTKKPNFYIYGQVIYPALWQPLPEGPGGGHE